MSNMNFPQGNNPFGGADFGGNPYQAPGQSYPQTGGGAQLATPVQRLLGFLIDSFLPTIFVIPCYIMVVVGLVMANQGKAPNDTPEFPLISIIGIGLMGLCGLGLLGVQIYLLATRSQTVGKYFLKMQIVDFETGAPAGLLNSLVLRIIVNSLISGLPCIGFIYFIVDSCYVFRDDRRCVHDLLASTSVVDISNR